MHSPSRRLALMTLLALTVVACGGGEPVATDTETETPTETETIATEEPTSTETSPPAVEVDRPERDEQLDLGYILPETGPLAFVGAPQITGVQLALDEINEAGGVLGSDVSLATGDEAGDAAVARQSAARLINEGVDAIVGAGASGMSQAIIQLLHDNEIVQCSASSTSPSFSEQANNDFFVRTVPPDQAVAPIIANRVLSDGYSNVAIVARADDYGALLSELVAASIEASGGRVAVNESYDPNISDFSSTVSAVQNSNADAVVIIGFGEAATLIRQLIEAGFPADGLYGGDGLFGPRLPDQVGVSIAGMTVIGASGGDDFNQRLNEALPEDQQGNNLYGGQAYDCAILIALAAQAAESTDPAVFVDELAAVTKDGTECSSFEECKGLLEEGEDIDYQGVSGPLNIEGTDPTFGRYAIAVFQDDGSLEVVDSQDVDLAEIE